ncbi:Peptidoglycan binding-like domain-containing protein [Gammaproteobacteria bacterium]
MKKRVVGAALVALSVVACAPMPNPETAVVAQRPATAPMKTLTSFSEALSCMDDLLLSRGTNIVITSAGLPDQTGEVKAGTKEMMISAISKMSIKSKGFKYVDYDPNQQDVNMLHQLIGGPGGPQGKNFELPRYYIRGAISQIDRGALQDSTSAGISFMGGGGGGSSGGSMLCDDKGCKPAKSGGGGGGNVGLGMGYNQQASSAVISIDVNIGNLLTRQIEPGMSATNSVVLTTKGQGFDFDASIQKVGLNFSKSLTRAEGPGAAVRTLIELSMIESLGKLAEVPYWQCLGQDSTSPDLLAKTREGYDKILMSERVKTVQAALSTSGHYRGSVTGVIDDATKDAISRYQSENNLIANGRVDFDLYYNLVVNRYIAGPVGSSSTNTASGGISVAAHSQEPGNRNVSTGAGTAIFLNLSSNKGHKPAFSLGENLQVTVGVSEPAFVYCYYQDSQGQVARIFPNRFSPNAAINAGQTIRVPPASLPFQLTMDKPGNRERVDCVASRKEIGIALPKDMMTEDLQPIPGRTVDDVVNELRGRDSGASHETLRILVSG